MKFTCTIDLDNAAFSESPSHLGHLIQSIGVDLGANGVFAFNPSSGKVSAQVHHPIRDLNGNTVGQWSIKEESND